MEFRMTGRRKEKGICNRGSILNRLASPEGSEGDRRKKLFGRGRLGTRREMQMPVPRFRLESMLRFVKRRCSSSLPSDRKAFGGCLAAECLPQPKCVAGPWKKSARRQFIAPS